MDEVISVARVMDGVPGKNLAKTSTGLVKSILGTV